MVDTKMRPRLLTVVESEDGGDDAIQFRGDLNHAGATAIRPDGRLVIQQLDVKRFAEVCNRAHEGHGTLGQTGVGDAQSVLVGKLFHSLNVLLESSALCEELFAREML